MNELDVEIVRLVEGFDGLYEVTSNGDVISLNWRGVPGKRHIMKPFNRNKNGYKSVNLYKNGVKYMFHVHYLVVKAFPEICGEWFDGAVINHKDEQVWNNKAINLEVCTVSYNNNYGTVKERIRETNIAKGNWCEYDSSSSEYREYWNARRKEYRANMTREQKDHHNEMCRKWYHSLSEERKKELNRNKNRTYVYHPRQKVKTADMVKYRKDYYRKHHPEVKCNRPVERTGKVMDIFLCRYDCLNAAAKDMGAIDASFISKAARGVIQKAYGYRWRYVE